MSRYASIKKFYILGENIARLLLDETFFPLFSYERREREEKISATKYETKETTSFNCQNPLIRIERNHLV